MTNITNMKIINCTFLNTTWGHILAHYVDGFIFVNNYCDTNGNGPAFASSNGTNVIISNNIIIDAATYCIDSASSGATWIVVGNVLVNPGTDYYNILGAAEYGHNLTI